MADYTPEQIEEMRTAIALADQKAAEDAAAARDAYIKPVRELVVSKPFKSVYATLSEMKSTYADDANLAVHITALADIMPRLAQISGVTLEQPVVEDAK